MICGAVCGIVAAAPLAICLQRDGADMRRGITAVAFAFLFLQFAILMVRVWRQEVVAHVGVTAALVFLAVTVGLIVQRESRR